MKSLNAPYDVAILGAGPAGSVAAHFLARSGRRVVMIDRPSVRRKVGESLPAAARPLLAHLHLLQVLDKPDHVAAYGNFSAWGSHEGESTDFIRDPNGLGWHVDRSRFDKDLREEARKAGAEIISGTVTRIARESSGPVLTLESGAAIRTQFLIDASGRQAPGARALGATLERDDDLIAVYAWVKAEALADPRTVIESAPEGWWYSSLLADQTRIVSFHTTPRKAGALMRDPKQWKQELSATEHVGVLVAPLEVELHATEAGGSRLDRFTGKDWLAVGDAAMAFDPLSSQGIFNALYGGMKAGQAVVAGDEKAFFEYEARLEKIWAVYQNHRVLYYSGEQRWLNHEFWQKRLFRKARAG